MKTTSSLHLRVLSLVWLGLLTFVLSPTLLSAENHFSNHVFFKHLLGDWKAEGKLTGQDGNVIEVTEDWKGRVSDEGDFIMEGSRKIGDSKQTFQWTLTYDASTGLYAVTHNVNSGEGDKQQRFEISVSETALTMELSTFLSDGNSKVTIKDSFAGDVRDTLNSEVTFVNDQGATTLSGTIVHKKS